MKVSSSAERLKEIMKERKLKQVDIVEACKPYCEKYGVKMNKSDISQYVAGKSEPAQHKLIVLSLALGVQESWLMGFDVPRTKEKPANNDGLTDSQRELIEFAKNCPEDLAGPLLQSMQATLEVWKKELRLLRDSDS